MKKWIQAIIFTILLWIPVTVLAKDGISNYYIDMTVEPNGDVTVEELFVLEGSFNGYERIINYKNSNVPTFDGNLSSFNGSDIYNGDSIIIREVKSIFVASNPTFEDIQKEGTMFSETISAEKGNYGIYTVENRYDGKKIKIYNPSNKGQKGFYIKYVITNMAIVHNDIAEIGFNLFTEEQKETIENLEMHIHIPGNKNELRAWGHGPLWGETENISQEEIHLYIKDLDNQQPVDIRFVFDKTAISNSTKYSRVEGLPSILTIETEKAEEANWEREQARESLKRHQTIRIVMIVINSIWLIGLVILIFYVYHKYDKEYKNTFPSKYYRDFPDTYGPEIVGYLLHRQISNHDLSASILNLIYKKSITFETLEKKDYRLINLHTTNVTDTEQKLLDWLFDGKDEIRLSTLKKEARKGYESFLKRYNAWKTKATKEGESYQFYEKSTKSKILFSLYSLLGLFLGVICIAFSLFGTLILFSAIISLIYFIIYQRRTVNGNEAYHKWMALKNYMVDFGNMDEKELPEIILWEKYLVYAVTLGCAKKLSKTMEIKVKELETSGEMIDTTVLDLHRMHVCLSLNQSLTQTVTSAINTANSVQIANSSDSSSGGFGGGFSGGGGSFGGGGGGGRF